MSLKICKENKMLKDSCVTPLFPSLSSLMFFLFNISFPYWVITHTAGCVAASATWHADRCPGISRQTTPRALFIVTLPAFCPNPLSDPYVTFATPKSGLQMTWLDCGEVAHMPRQLERVLVRTSKEMGCLIWLPCVCRQLVWTTGALCAVMWLWRTVNCGNI